ncbi:hypothetical protein Lalb_Chr18g0049951 [Lupinus albus]|uniref:Uncharacterized protein n=1 Tax=Lupinus albus TaxID=3870 RepID=A0A6A4P3A8_LUPAL|nr:hypothetical protein Lalb_Chr18g0049951 [Lupinus albus]
MKSTMDIDLFRSESSFWIYHDALLLPLNMSSVRSCTSISV